MTTDRELLELAAKAAGYQVVGNAHQVIAQGVSYHALVIRNERGGDSVFDPLDDDGDALRLAVKIGLDFYEGDDDGRAAYVGYYERRENTKPPRFMIERHDAHADPYAATRRAIVRAAAAMGAST